MGDNKSITTVLVSVLILIGFIVWNSQEFYLEEARIQKGIVCDSDSIRKAE